MFQANTPACLKDIPPIQALQMKHSHAKRRPHVTLSPLDFESLHKVSLEILAYSNETLKYSPPAFTGGPSNTALIVYPRGENGRASQPEAIHPEAEYRPLILLLQHERNQDIPFLPIVKEVAKIKAAYPTLRCGLDALKNMGMMHQH